MRNLFLTDRFFYLFGGIVVLFGISYPLPILFSVAQTLLLLAVALVLADVLGLFLRRHDVVGHRQMSEQFSLGDANLVQLHFENRTKKNFNISIIDELPFQFQERNFQENIHLPAGESANISYELTPKTRGEYHFGVVNAFLSSKIGLIERRLPLANASTVKVYPSVIQMKKFELKALRHIANETGIKKIRRLGHSYEFEQIKNYVEGDDYRSINWKASSRRNELMVNTFEDEKSQQVWCIIDKSRSMRMPFEGLSLMDYAINSTLALSNIILKKDDKAGLITFSNVLGATVSAENRGVQLRRILDALYREKERPMESNFELLYQAVRRLIAVRSLLIIFTNFESHYALQRVLPHLRRLAKLHLVVVVFFENTTIAQQATAPARTTLGIFEQSVARKFLQEKKEMVRTLQQFGIQTVLTKPGNLTLNTINKYLELKSRGLI